MFRILQTIVQEETGRLIRSVPGSEPGVTSRTGFSDHGSVYTISVLLVTDKIHLSQGRERIFAQELARLLRRALSCI